jgi:hypothetical protein
MFACVSVVGCPRQPVPSCRQQSSNQPGPSLTPFDTPLLSLKNRGACNKSRSLVIAETSGDALAETSCGSLTAMCTLQLKATNLLFEVEITTELKSGPLLTANSFAVLWTRNTPEGYQSAIKLKTSAPAQISCCPELKSGPLHACTFLSCLKATSLLFEPRNLHVYTASTLPRPESHNSCMNAHKMLPKQSPGTRKLPRK